ncbi:uncharacterized protein LOC123526897 [Mercenaria mercenaria]|uniref:uncharacterized protein LOC123526897 n=1 Tax=Mercenaria mercenaria TaxID=6596 RepID=UPI00234F4000|nr:uncharacterized protein LOC123526897 [Mercenaria mercenaria]
MSNFSHVLRNIRQFFEKEKTTGKPWHINNVTKRLSVATGLSKTTICKLESHNKKGASELTTFRPTARCKLDSFDLSLLRRCIHSYYKEGQHLTLDTLQKRLKDQHDISVSRSSVYRSVLKMGFRFYKNGFGSRLVKERQDIVCRRHEYLRKIKKARLDGDIIVYVDETWVNANHCMKGEWSDSSVSDTSKLVGGGRGACKFTPSGKGKRLIVLDAGCRNVGLIPGVGEVFVAQNDGGDYHSEMNHKHFFSWWKITLLPVLPGTSTIVIDKASYRSMLTEDSRSPTTASRIGDIRDWLRKRRLPFNDDMIKAKLLEIVRRNKPRPKYIVDELAMEAGHKVLRLPPRHCELNPIELIWAKMKGHVARQNSSFKLKDTMALFQKSRALITPAYWNRCEDHVILKIEKELWRTGGVQEDEVAPVVIPLGEADDSDSDSDGELSEDEEGLDDTDC